MLVLIPLLPFVGFLINTLLRRRLPKALSGTVATGAMAAAFAVAVMSVADMLGREAVGGVRAVEQTVFTWFASGALQIPLTFRVDPLASVMILVVTGIGTLIHLYSIAYMHDESDSEYARYFSYLNLFAAFMLVLVLGANFPVMFVGWEGVGLCSYLLIGFWFTKQSASDAGKKAFIVNRVGDFGFILGMLAIFATFRTLDFQGVARLVAAMPPEMSFGILTLITLLLFLGATGKSAQIPLYVWLPDAMEGPTPVSALIHAATMVTAGVYMIGRNAVLFSHAPITLGVVAVVGAFTALVAGTIGLVQNDIKRVLAYSTVSQLGYMFLAMGVGAFSAGIFHLYTHAFFKALLFLGSGAVIHALHGEQDLRKMGGLRKALPITFWTFLIGTLAISGVPLLSGFFSKDEILWSAFAHGSAALWALAVITAFLTATYMFRLLYMAFFGARRGDTEPGGAHGHGTHDAHAHDADDAHAHGHGGHDHGGHLHDAPPAMATALVILAVGSVVAGYVGVPEVLMHGGNRIEHYLAPSFQAAGAPASVIAEGAASPAAAAATAAVPAPADVTPAPAPEAQGEAGHAGATHSARTELTLMGLSTAIALLGILLATFMFLKRPDVAATMASQFAPIHRLLLNKYYVDEIYNGLIVQPIKYLSTGLLWKGIDAGLIDGTVNGVGLVVRGWSAVLRRLQTGSVRAYAMSLFAGVVMIVGYYLWP